MKKEIFESSEPRTEYVQSACLFCQRDNSPTFEDRLIYEDELFLASHRLDEQAPSYLGLVLIQTKRHVNDLGELTEAEAERLGTLIRRVSQALKATTGAAWTYCYCFMEGVRHVHAFVTARYPGVPQEYVRLDTGNWPRAPVGGQREVVELAKRLRSMIAA